jgi:hypothetical protein
MDQARYRATEDEPSFGPSEQILRESRVAEKIDAERAQLFEVWMRGEGWKVYQSLLATIIEERGMALLSPSGSIDGVLVAEYNKGAMCGLILARDLPSIIVAHMKASTPVEDFEDAQ